MNVTITINIPGQPVHEHSVTTTDAKAEASTCQQERDTATTTATTTATDDTSAPASKRRKTDSTNAGGVVASSVADRAQGPGVDPTSRFSYVYTSKHDHGTLEHEVVRREHEKWTGLSDAMTHMKKHCDTHLTLLLKAETAAAASSSSSSSSNSKER